MPMKLPAQRKMNPMKYNGNFILESSPRTPAKAEPNSVATVNAAITHNEYCHHFDVFPTRFIGTLVVLDKSCRRKYENYTE